MDRHSLDRLGNFQMVFILIFKNSITFLKIFVLEPEIS